MPAAHFDDLPSLAASDIYHHNTEQDIFYVLLDFCMYEYLFRVYCVCVNSWSARRGPEEWFTEL